MLDAIAAGRWYDVEAWVAAGRPVQFATPSNRRRTHVTPLEASIRQGAHDVAFLLLANGYDPNLDRVCPLTLALERRRTDVFELLLAWGADPQRVGPRVAVAVYDVPLLERLWRLGIDLTAGAALEDEVSHATTNRQLYGFLKRHAHEDPTLQAALNRGLYRAVDREGANEKAASLCVWAGADPWAYVPEPRDGPDDGACEAGWRLYRSAAGQVVAAGRTALLRPLRISPNAPRFQDLFGLVYDEQMFQVLAAMEPPRDLDAVATRALAMVSEGSGAFGTAFYRILKRALAAGGRVRDVPEHAAKSLRRILTGDGHAFPGPRELIDILQDPKRTDETAFLRVIASPKVVLRARRLRVKRTSLEALLASPTCSSSAAVAVRRELRRWRRPRDAPN